MNTGQEDFQPSGSGLPNHPDKAHSIKSNPESSECSGIKFQDMRPSISMDNQDSATPLPMSVASGSCLPSPTMNPMSPLNPMTLDQAIDYGRYNYPPLRTSSSPSEHSETPKSASRKPKMSLSSMGAIPSIVSNFAKYVLSLILSFSYEFIILNGR